MDEYNYRETLRKKTKKIYDKLEFIYVSLNRLRQLETIS